MYKRTLRKLVVGLSAEVKKFPTVWAKINAVSLVLGLSAVLAIGPHLQTYSVALLTSQEASIYSTAYSTSLVIQPKLIDWLIDTWHPLFIGMAMLIVLLSVRAARARTTFILGSVVTFLTLTSSDLIYLATNDLMSGASLAESVFANLFGAPLVLSIVIGMIFFGDGLARILVANGKIRRVIVPLSAPLVGLFLLIITYYLVALFYNPTESQVIAVASPPVTANYSVTDLRAKAGEMTGGPEETQTAGPKFGLFGKPAAIPTYLHWSGEAKKFGIQWQNSSDAQYDLYVGIFDGCFGKDKAPPSEVRSPLLFKQVDQISISADDGLADLSIGDGAGGGYFKMPPEAAGMFWINRADEKKNTFNVTSFLDENAQMSYWDPTGDARLALSVMLINPSESRSRELSDRKITLHVDEKKYGIYFRPNIKAKWAETIGCDVVKAPKNKAEHRITTSLNAGISILLRPRDQTLGASLLRRDNDEFQIKGLNGWLAAEAVPEGQVDEFINSGELGMLSFASDVKRFEINGEKFETSKDDQFAITYGLFTAGVNKAGELTINGKAEAIYKNSERINKTRWERLEWPARAMIFGGIPTFLFWLCSVLVRLLKEDKELGYEIFAGEVAGIAD